MSESRVSRSNNHKPHECGRPESQRSIQLAVMPRSPGNARQLGFELSIPSDQTSPVDRRQRDNKRIMSGDVDGSSVT